MYKSKLFKDYFQWHRYDILLEQLGRGRGVQGLKLASIIYVLKLCSFNQKIYSIKKKVKGLTDLPTKFIFSQV